MTLRSRRTKPRRRARAEAPSTSLVGTGLRRGKVERRSTRVRNVPYMIWVKTLSRCCAAHLGPCDGPMEADHDNRGRGMSQKASDHLTWPMCKRHHTSRTDFHDEFKVFDQARMRAFMEAAIKETQMLFRQAFPTVAAWDSWVARCEALRACP